MSPEQEHKLLELSLEFSSAKEHLAAMEAFSRYLTLRFQPKEINHHDLDRATDEANHFPKNKIFFEDGSKFHFLLNTSIPVVFVLDSCKGSAPDPKELAVLEKIVRFFDEKMQTIADLKGLTYTDDLTGLYNQRYLELILDREISLSKRNETQFSVLFMDLDHFKNVNDTHGHLIGSRLLYEVGQEVKKTLRESDITFRYGGDEFVMILSHTDLKDAVLVAERVRVQIEKKRFLVREGLEIRLTASIGVANVPDHAETKQQILRAADAALYGVKKAVRNKVIAATASFKD